MFDKSLLAEAGRLASNPTLRVAEHERIVFARMVAESHRLEGIMTSEEAVLSTVDEETHVVA